MYDIQITERIRAAYTLNTPKLKKEVQQILYPAKNLPPGNIICKLCSNLSNLLPLIQCSTCGYWFHCDCLKIPQSYLSKPPDSIQNGKWNCESCYDNNIDPFNKVESTLTSFKIDRNFQITTINFSLSQQTLKYIMDNKYSVLIRLYDIFNGDGKIDFDNIVVIVNGQFIKITETKLYKFLKCDKNAIQFRYKTIPSNVVYCGSILCTKAYKIKQLVQYIRNYKYIPLSNSIRFVKNFFKCNDDDKNGDDDDVAKLVHLDISTHCPLGLNRIETPVRGLYCNHIQCFDLYNYLSLNNMNPKWICPACNHYCPFTQLIVDPFYDQILKSNGEIIRIKPDGSWVVQEQEDNDEDEENNDDGENDGSNNKEKRKFEVIDIVDDSDDDNNNNVNDTNKRIRTS